MEISLRTKVRPMSGYKRSLFVVFGSLGLTAFNAAFLFFIAGRWDLPMFWAWVVVFGIMSLVAFAVIDPDLMKERIKPGPGAKDKSTVYLAKSVITLHLVVSALDVGRYHWSDTIPFWLQIAGLVVLVLGITLTVTCMVINRYFSAVVRIQKDRGHQLITTGPYAVVRHPGYTGIMSLAIGSGLLLGSWWGCAPVLVFALMIFRRLLFEDRFLHEEMDGYAAYAQRVKYRLLPGLW